MARDGEPGFSSQLAITSRKTALSVVSDIFARRAISSHAHAGRRTDLACVSRDTLSLRGRPRLLARMSSSALRKPLPPRPVDFEKSNSGISRMAAALGSADARTLVLRTLLILFPFIAAGPTRADDAKVVATLLDAHH
jgi:hypothetical protein